jgi:diaminopimelate epimerase
MNLTFSKMHALGNDFVIINALHHPIPETLPIQTLSHRNLGIGFDQLLIIQPGNANHFFCKIYNADGSEAKQCGNGLRCVARYLHEQGIIQGNELTLETISGNTFPVQIHNYQDICISMGIPQIQDLQYPLKVGAKTLTASILTLGNPHLILSNTPFDASLATQIAQRFPGGINVGFMQIVDPDYIKLRTFERGSGETLACGSNACAAVISGILQEHLHKQVTVALTHGQLKVTWANKQKPVHLSGPASLVFNGEIKL